MKAGEFRNADNEHHGLPPWGGSGLKDNGYADVRVYKASPSLGREWIERKGKAIFCKSYPSLPPWGGSGLKAKI